MKTATRAAVGVLGAIIAVTGVTACGANDAGDDDAPRIALLLPESKTTRYETFDKPIFEDKVKELCDECVVDYFNADQSSSKQQQQAESALTNGADVLVFDPVDGEAAAGAVRSAQESDIPVVAYDRFMEGADYYLSFDNEQVGVLQGEALLEATGGTGNILMLNGSPTDPNAAQFKSGAHSVLDGSGLTIVAEYDNPDWSPDNAQQFTSSQLSNTPADQIAGVLAANDGQAGGVIAALRSANVAELPPVTGQDAELAAIQRIVAGEQYMTVYKSIKIEAEKAAELAVALVQGEEVTDTEDFEGVPSYIFDPVIVTQENVADTVVADGFHSVEDICTDEYADACSAIGLS